jgi:outer membrane biosynthesis protein TonB
MGLRFPANSPDCHLPWLPAFINPRASKTPTVDSRWRLWARHHGPALSCKLTSLPSAPPACFFKTPTSQNPQLIRDGDFGLGIMGLRWRPASCSYIGPVRINADGSTTPIPGAAGAGGSTGTTDPGRPPQPSQPAPPSTARPPAPAPTPTPPAPRPPTAPTPPPTPTPTPPAPRPPAPTPTPTSTLSRPSTPAPPASRPPAGPPPPASRPPAAAPSNPPAPQPSGGNNGGNNNNNSNNQKKKKKLYVEAQCGGTSGRCNDFGGSSACKDKPFANYECADGLNCVRQSQYYWQCWDPTNKSTLDSNWSKTKPQGTKECPKYRPLNQQCGGTGGDCQGGDCKDEPIDACCEPGLSCVRFDQYYWECRKQ